MTVRLIHTNGSTVAVDDAQVDALLASGFSEPAPADAPEKDEPKKPAARRRGK